uniref:Uncharacterized protein n=1 Tax=Mola mola TaxID=94237 RepID=A0A3Q3W4I6_MOLML
MEKATGFSPERNVLCLFDVDGTLTPPRQADMSSRLGYCKLFPFRGLANSTEWSLTFRVKAN